MAAGAVTAGARGRGRASGGAEGGWTLIELLVLIALVGILTTIVLPMFLRTIERAKFNRAVSDMRMIEFEINQFETRETRLPDDLDELMQSIQSPLPLDPWGRPYRYFVFRGPGWRGVARKDRFLVPINSNYDLYSVGVDGETRPPLQNPVSHDDVVRANDGYFYGYGRDF